jgi:hypothetical protein
MKRADPREIAKGLSPAQAKALLAIPTKRDFKPEYYGQWSCLSHLKAKRLINGVKEGMAGMGKTALHRITPTGLAVRAILENEYD